MIAPDPKTVREIAREFLLDDDLTADDLGYAVRRHTGYGMPAEEFQAWRNAVDADVEEATVTKVASWPDEQQPEFECEVCTKPITAYPCVLCEHEPDPWKKPDEQQPADVVTAEQQQDGAADLCRETDMHGSNVIHHCALSTPGHRAHQCGDCGHMWADGGQGFEAVLAERDQLRQLLGIGIDCEQWDAIAEAEGCRYEVEQTNDTLVGYLAYQRESSRALSGFLQREVKELEAERTALAARVVELESERDEDARTVDAVGADEDDELLDRAISNLIARFADRIEALDATETEES